MKTKAYIPVRDSQLRYYVRIPLYFETAPGVFQLYKPSGTEISELQIDQGLHPRLFVQETLRMDAIREVHKGFNQEIVRSMETGDIASVKATLCKLVAETLTEPRAGNLHTLPQTIGILVSGYSKQPGILRTLATISNKDYTTVVHSINVMALTLSYCFHSGLSVYETKRLGLGGLLHDIGKVKIPTDIISAPRRLTPDEFEMMKSHPTIGEQLVRQIGRLGEEAAQGALEHHEKLDGSGYPRRVKKISFAGQLIGIIDCYEALTNEDRPYRRAKSPLDTLKLIKEDVEKGKFNRELFEKFCYSLI